jgi:cellulose synthase/poly-beta-1,6-N-acetylglucosamine synthase-like glycosyltransferase
MGFALIYNVILYIVYLALCAAFLPYFFLLLATSLAAIFAARKNGAPRPPGTSRARPRSCFLVAIPAHDEEPDITLAVLSCRALNYPPELFQVVVIADNCTDRTADLARAAGARVVERTDRGRRGKGYAIEYLIEHLRSSGEFDTLDALVVVDADTTVDPELLRVFDRELAAGHDWVQSYDCVGNPHQSWRTRLITYAFSLINGVTLLGLNALGLSAGLRGNGMCLSTRGLRRIPWNSHGLTEDLEYSWLVRIAGGHIVLARDAVVYATMLGQAGSALTNQRRRWESGRRELRWKALVPLLRTPHLGWFAKAVSLIELTMPTAVGLISIYSLLSLLAIACLADILARDSYIWIGLVGLFHSVATLGLAVHLVSPFLSGLLPWRFSLSLVHFPRFALWKLMISLKGRPHDWVRTPREETRPRLDREPAN